MFKKLFTILFAICLPTRVFSGCYFTDAKEYIRVDESVYRECYCYNDDNPNLQRAELKWVYPNGTDIPIKLGPGPKGSMFTEQQGHYAISLNIPKLSETMSGTYKCIYKFNDYTKVVQNYTIHAYELPYFISTPDSQFITFSKDSTVNCKVRGGTGNLYATWNKQTDDSIENLNDKERYIPSHHALLIKNVTMDDAGIYICTFMDTETAAEISTKINVSVMTKPEIKDLIASPDNTVVEGYSLIVECIAEGIPEPQYIWRKLPDMKNPQGGNISFDVVMNKLIFKSIKADDQGTYECVAKNLAGEDKYQIFIKVLVPPIITEFKNITAVKGTTVQIICNAIGRPEPNVTIIYMGEEPSDYMELTEYNIIDNFAFLQVNESKEGYYLCNASNEVDFVTETMYLAVFYSPYFKVPIEDVWGWNGISVNLSCESEGKPKPYIFWTYEGNEMLIGQPYLTLNVENSTYYGRYECLATNFLGNSTKIINFKEGYVPSPVEFVDFDVSATDTVIRIERPSDYEGPDIIGYTAEYDKAEMYNNTNIHLNRTWSIDREEEGFKLNNLRPETMYYIKFAAINNVGIGEWSQTISFETSSPSVPDIPTWEVDSDFLNISDSQALKWAAPQDNGAQIEYYLLNICKDCFIDESCKELRVTSTTELELNTQLLDSNGTYCLLLRAHNSVGSSTAANITVYVADIRSVAALSAGTIIGLAVIIVIVSLVLLDVLFCVWRRQGIIANSYYKKSKKRKVENVQTRDKKGLLKSNFESASEDKTKKHKEYEYNKTTGIITGKHSAV